MKNWSAFPLLLVLLSSCDKEDMINNEFRVVVESTSDISCSLPVIRFLDREAEVKSLTNSQTLTYNAYHLDPSLNILGNSLLVEFTQIVEEDLRPCLDIGISYPGISIQNARIAD